MAESLARIATKLIFEDDHVRVWQQVVPAGGTIEKHQHELDYFLVNVAGEGPFDITFTMALAARQANTPRSRHAPAPRTTYLRGTSRPRTIAVQSIEQYSWN
ncbi:MAG: hypothetical protein HC809_09155 [Gammaproteobacteria bacterium]|nr:hypothetical protein [Gammaproteobacteria bacterium]